MHILISIKSQYIFSIFNGTKQYEYRKKWPMHTSIKQVMIYATKPVGKIVGQFEIENILESTPQDIWEKTKKYAGISQHWFKAYFNKKTSAIALKIKNPYRYEEPLKLQDIHRNLKPPQNYYYIDENKQVFSHLDPYFRMNI